jgi:hypothetical protein
MEGLMRCLAIGLVLLVFTPAAVRGQTTAEPVSPVDVAVSTGWFAADRRVSGNCCALWSAGLFKGVSAGYYWTDHLKTETAVASPGATEAYGTVSERLTNGSFRYTSERHRYEGTKFSVAEIYQFGHNSTFHPFVVAGLDVDRERDAIERYVSTSDAHFEDARTAVSVRTRAFAGAGFKAYFSERAFFRGEGRLAGGRAPNQMTWTAGVGVDLGGARPLTVAGRTAAGTVVRGQEPADVWRDYVSRLRPGAPVDVKPAGSDRFTGKFVAADADGILVNPTTRVPEPVRRVPFDRLETLALQNGPRAGARVGATLVGIGAGAGTLTFMLFLLGAFLD